MGNIRKFTKEGPRKFVSVMKRIFVLLTIVSFFAMMVLLVLCFNTTGGARVAYSGSAALVAAVYFSLYGYYTLNISMGTVLGIEVTDKVVHLITQRKTFTYDVRMGCVAVKKSRSRYIGMFATQNSRDKFIFYRHAPFSKYSDEQFTDYEIGLFFPYMEEMEEE